jgi:hypothetical protein
MQTLPEITFEDIPIEECVNGSSSYDSNSDSDCSSDFELSSQTDLINEVEVVLTFLRCRAYMFKYSANYAMNYNKSIYIASLSFSSLLTILPLLVSYEKWLLILISIFGALTTGLTIAGKHARFDLDIQKYNSVAKSYVDVENELATLKSTTMYSYDKHRLLYEKIREVETKLMEIKKCATPVYPGVQVAFPLISVIDIYSEIHKIETKRKQHSGRLTSIRYEIRRIVADVDSVKNDTKQKSRLRFLFDSKKKIKDELETINYSQIITDMEMERKMNIIVYIIPKWVG